MRRLTVLAWISVLVVLFTGSISWAGDAEVIEAIVKAHAEVKPIALPSGQIAGLTIDQAYKLQNQLAKAILAKGDKVGGFKAGLTSEATQKRFGVDRALLGPLFKSGELSDGAVVNPKDYVRLFIETEVGYVAGAKIDKPVKDVEALKKSIKEVFPAVELPDMRFDDMKNLKGPDIVVDVIGSSKYIVGKRVPANTVDVSTVVVTLNMDGNEVNKGKASDALGNQWDALLWLVNGAVAQGWTVEPGQVFITGALGNMIPGKPGKYEGNYGPLGTLSFTVK